MRLGLHSSTTFYAIPHTSHIRLGALCWQKDAFFAASCAHVSLLMASSLRLLGRLVLQAVPF